MGYAHTFTTLSSPAYSSTLHLALVHFVLYYMQLLTESKTSNRLGTDDSTPCSRGFPYLIGSSERVVHQSRADHTA
jgi:hypothetical protein